MGVEYIYTCIVVRVMVFNVNNISFISWRSVLLVEETGVPWENHRPAASHWQTLSHNVVSSTPRLSRIRTHNVTYMYCAMMSMLQIFSAYFVGIAGMRVFVLFQWWFPLALGKISLKQYLLLGHINTLSQLYERSPWEV